MKQILP